MNVMKLRDAERADAQHVMRHLRPADRRELRRLGRPSSDVLASFDASDIVRAIDANDAPAALFGRCRSRRPGVFVVWMLATPAIDGVRRPFVRACRPELQRLRCGSSFVYNVTHRESAEVIRWLRWLGFTFDIGAFGPRADLLQFWMTGIEGVMP